MKQININNLPKYSRWPSRLLDEEHAARNKTRIQKEYEDKYSKLLTYKKAHPKAHMSDIRMEHFRSHLGKKKDICISKKGELYLAHVSDVIALAKNAVLEKLIPIIKDSDYIIELGSGYGYYTYYLSKAYPKCTFVGADFSNLGVTLSRRLCKAKNISFVPFDFYKKDSYPKPESTKNVIFTVSAIEQIPSAQLFLSRMRQFKNQISDIVNFEPIYEFNDVETTLGLMRKKYASVNNYNKDLFSLLKNSPSEIEIVKMEHDIFGVNPLNPTSFIHWRFKK